MSDATERAGKDAVFDLLVVGAGPTGLATAIEAKKAGYRVVLVDKGCVCNSIFHYPEHMTFFTTSELLEIGGIPFPSPNAKPTRIEALDYYRKLAVAIGYYDLPNWMGIPGETLSKVEHYYHDPHPYFGTDVAIIGAKNSA